MTLAPVLSDFIATLETMSVAEARLFLARLSPSERTHLLLMLGNLIDLIHTSGEQSHA
jgi:hypothetical protein